MTTLGPNRRVSSPLSSSHPASLSACRRVISSWPPRRLLNRKCHSWNKTCIKMTHTWRSRANAGHCSPQRMTSQESRPKRGPSRAPRRWSTRRCASRAGRSPPGPPTRRLCSPRVSSIRRCAVQDLDLMARPGTLRRLVYSRRYTRDASIFARKRQLWLCVSRCTTSMWVN